ncbi:MAG: ferrous iron transport protein B [Bacteroidota bacterium]
MKPEFDHEDKHKHLNLPLQNEKRGRLKIVLVGNPNVGKSLIFNRLSGMHVEVSNFPGTTVELIKGEFEKYDLYDTPGIYGISSFNEEECVARDIILGADIIINVVDSMHLERDLFLTQQVIDTGKKVVVLLNFMDEVAKNHVKIDFEMLGKFMGVQIIPFTAADGKGFEKLSGAVELARQGTQREELHSMLHYLLNRVGSQAEALLIAEGDHIIAERHGVARGMQRDKIYIDRRNRVNYIIDNVVIDVSGKRQLSEYLGRWCIRPITGVPILLLALYMMYLFVGKFVAQELVGYTEGILGKTIWEPWLRHTIGSFIPESTWLYTLLLGEFGVITMTTTYLIFLLLPLVIAFYITLSLMEDSGYLPRLATMVDKSLSGLGLNGKAVIPLILGFGCVTSATITTRMLGTEREKTIATTILQFAIPCSAQLAVIAALLAGAGFGPMLIYISVILAVLIAIGTILNNLIGGRSEPLLLDLPTMRLPRARNVLRKTLYRTTHFMMEASLWFFIGALGVGVAQMTGALQYVTNLLVPLTTHWLQLPPQAATAFVMGIVRRDFGAAGLYQLSLTPMQITVALVTITLFVPCIASLMVMMKERGVKEGMIIWVGTWVAGFAVGGFVSHLVM